MGLVDTTSTGWWIGFALAVVMSVGGFFAHFLTLWGSIAAFGVGFVVATSDAGAMAMLMTFFLAGSFATKFKKARKRALLEQGDLPEAQEMAAAARHSKSKGRTHVQVLATGGVPALLCLTRFMGLSSWRLMFVAYMSVNCGDTLASELGMLSTSPPILITSGKRVAPGQDGGVTLWGTVAAALGGVLMAACDLGVVATVGAPDHFVSIQDTLITCVVSAVVGSTADSLLGAVLQQPAPGAAQKWQTWKLMNSVVNVVSALVVAGTLLATVSQPWLWPVLYGVTLFAFGFPVLARSKARAE